MSDGVTVTSVLTKTSRTAALYTTEFKIHKND